MTALDEYREGVDSLTKQGMHAERHISDSDHFKVWTYFLIKNSSSEIRIFSKCLDSIIYDDPKIITETENALNRGVNFDILCQENPESKAYLDFSKNFRYAFRYANKFSLRTDLPNWAKNDGYKNGKENFLIMDCIGYLYLQHGNLYRGTADANDNITCKSLLTMFEKVKNY